MELKVLKTSTAPSYFATTMESTATAQGQIPAVTLQQSTVGTLLQGTNSMVTKAQVVLRATAMA